MTSVKSEINVIINFFTKAKRLNYDQIGQMDSPDGGAGHDLTLRTGAGSLS